MSSSDPPEFVPMIALCDRAAKVMKVDMVRHAATVGHDVVQPSHNAVFATLPAEGARAAVLAQRNEITRQSMGEVIRDMAARGLVEMAPDPHDGRAKIVRYTPYGLQVANDGFGHILDIDRMLRSEFGDDAVDATTRVLNGIVRLLDAGSGLAPTPPEE